MSHREGLLTLDHRESPGISNESCLRTGLPAGVGHGLAELKTLKCGHGEHFTVINPLRTRARAYCRYCKHYLCDGCGAIFQLDQKCIPFNKRLDELYETALNLKE